MEHYRDPCCEEDDRSREQAWVPSSVVLKRHIHDPELHTPLAMLATLSSPAGRDRFLEDTETDADVGSTDTAAAPSSTLQPPPAARDVPRATRPGRRIDYAMVHEQHFRAEGAGADGDGTRHRHHHVTDLDVSFSCGLCWERAIQPTLKTAN